MFPFDEIKSFNLKRQQKHASGIGATHAQKLPVYTVLESNGPDHNKSFTVAVLVDGKKLPSIGKKQTRGTTRIAKQALEILGKA